MRARRGAAEGQKGFAALPGALAILLLAGLLCPSASLRLSPRADASRAVRPKLPPGRSGGNGVPVASAESNRSGGNSNGNSGGGVPAAGALVLALALGFASPWMERDASAASLPLVNSLQAAPAPAAVGDIMRDRFAALRSAVTGEKVSELRVGDTLVDRLRAVDGLLDGLQKDIYRDDVDWEAIEVYPKIFRAYSPLFTAYTDRAFPDNTDIASALRYALRYEVGGFYSGVTDFEKAVTKQSQRQAQRAFARMSIAYDHYLKAGDLYSTYEGDNLQQADLLAGAGSGPGSGSGSGAGSGAGSGSAAAGYYSNPQQLSYIAPSIEAPGLQDEVVLLKGPDKGRVGVVLWIFKDEATANNVPQIVVKLDKGDSGHSEVRLYPYSLVAKTTPPEVQFVDDLLAAYVASAISSGIMYPIDSYKTRVQCGKRGVPGPDEGGVAGLWKGVECE